MIFSSKSSTDSLEVISAQRLSEATGRGSFSAYWGLGGVLGGGSKDNEGFIFLAGRVPLGLEYMYRQISFYGEIDPMLRLLPSIGLGLGAGIGFRFYP